MPAWNSACGERMRDKAAQAPNRWQRVKVPFPVADKVTFGETYGYPSMERLPAIACRCRPPSKYENSDGTEASGLTRDLSSTVFSLFRIRD